jgi:hypothetical protein
MDFSDYYYMRKTKEAKAPRRSAFVLFIPSILAYPLFFYLLHCSAARLGTALPYAWPPFHYIYIYLVPLFTSFAHCILLRTLPSSK